MKIPFTLQKLSPKRAIMAVAIALILLVLMGLASCTVKKRVAESTWEKDKTQSDVTGHRSRQEQTDSDLFRQWQENYLQELAKHVTLKIVQKDSAAALKDKEGNEIAPARIVDTRVNVTADIQQKDQGNTKEQDMVALHMERKDTVDVHADIKKDIDSGVQEKALPVERTAMWVFFSIVLLVVIGVSIYRKI